MAKQLGLTANDEQVEIMWLSTVRMNGKVALFYETYLSLTFSPSGEMVTIRRGIFLPLVAMAFFTATSRPPQQGTSIRVRVMLRMALPEIMAVSFSL